VKLGIQGQKVTLQEHAHQMMVGAIVQMGNFMSMATSGKWWKIKNKYLNLLLDRGDRSRKGKRT